VGQIQKKGSKALLLPLLLSAPCSAASALCHLTGKRLHWCLGSVFTSIAPAWPGKGLSTHSVTLHKVAGKWKISVEKKDEEHSSKMAT